MNKEQKRLKAARELAAEVEPIVSAFIFPDLDLKKQNELIKIALHEFYRKNLKMFKLKGVESNFGTGSQCHINLCWGRVFVDDKHVLRKNLQYDHPYKSWAVPNHWWVALGKTMDTIIDYRLQDRINMRHQTIPHGCFAKRDFMPHYQYLNRGEPIKMNLNLTTKKLMEEWGLN